MLFIYKDPLIHREMQFVNLIYDAPVGVLLKIKKKNLRRALTRAKLVCCWLEGVLQLINNLDREGK